MIITVLAKCSNVACGSQLDTYVQKKKNDRKNRIELEAAICTRFLSWHLVTSWLHPFSYQRQSSGSELQR